MSSRQERLERVWGLRRAALDLARGRRPEGNLLIDGERKRFYEFTAGSLRITVLRAFPLDPNACAETSSLRMLSEGEIVLSVRWSDDDYEIMTFKPGNWEMALR